MQTVNQITILALPNEGASELFISINANREGGFVVADLSVIDDMNAHKSLALPFTLAV
jgi:hypothetical protein